MKTARAEALPANRPFEWTGGLFWLWMAAIRPARIAP